MERELLFRAKRSDNKEWVFGLLHFNKKYILPNTHHNNYDEWIEIIQGTEGQYIGIDDKNGKKIFEGDVVKYYQPYAKKWCTHVVKYDKLFASFGLFENGNEWCIENDWLKIQEIEVIGDETYLDIKLSDAISITKIKYDNIASGPEEYKCFNFTLKLITGNELLFFAKSRKNDYSIIEHNPESNNIKYVVVENGVDELKKVYNHLRTQIDNEKK